MNVNVGDSFSWTKTFSREEILAFAELTGDTGFHHTRTEKVMAHGLLVASLPTKLGGDLNFIASDMHFNFLHAVFEGDTVTCSGTVKKSLRQKSRTKLEFEFVCTNQDGLNVMRGSSKGFIPSG